MFAFQLMEKLARLVEKDVDAIVLINLNEKDCEGIKEFEWFDPVFEEVEGNALLHIGQTASTSKD